MVNLIYNVRRYRIINLLPTKTNFLSIPLVLRVEVHHTYVISIENLGMLNNKGNIEKTVQLMDIY